MTTRRGRGRPPREAEAAQETEDQRQVREAAEAEAREADDQDDADDGDDQDEADEAGNGDGDPEADLAAMSRTNYDDLDQPEAAFLDESGDGLSIGQTMTPRQQVGIDPANALEHAEQASNRNPLLNAQTDHERYAALDAVSGTANPGITREHTHSAPGALGATDMSGRPAMADPLAGAGPVVRGVLDRLRRTSADAIQAGKRGHGYLSLRDLNVNKAVMDALVAGGHVTQENRPGGGFNPETGTVYRIAGHQEPEPRAK